LAFKLLTKAEVTDFDMAISIDQNIIGLDISMNVITVMYFLKCDNNLSDIEFGLLF
jgi:hypothetical protein